MENHRLRGRRTGQEAREMRLTDGKLPGKQEAGFKRSKCEVTEGRQEVTHGWQAGEGQVREMSMAQQIKLEKSYGNWKQTGASDLRNQVAG